MRIAVSENPGALISCRHPYLRSSAIISISPIPDPAISGTQAAPAPSAPAPRSISERALRAAAPPYMHGLNPEQTAAVEALDGPVLVLVDLAIGGVAREAVATIDPTRGAARPGRHRRRRR